MRLLDELVEVLERAQVGVDLGVVGDGLVDLVAENPNAAVKVSLSTGSGWTNQTWTGHTKHSTTTYSGSSYSVLSYYTKLADMDGDSRPDLVAFERFQQLVDEARKA